MTLKRDLLDLTKKTDERLKFEEVLKKRVIGQDDALDKVSRAYEMARVGMCDKSRPLANILLLGPTGTGKTLLVESVAEAIHSDPRCMTKISCVEYQSDHEISKLIGAPPGYVGHMDTVPVLNPADLTKGWLDNGPHIAIVLFDEVEKASPALWQLLLGIMDKAEVTTGKKEKLNLNCVMLFMTSNVGSREITQDNIGFTKVDKQSRSKEIDVLARAAARKKFPPEFMGRLDDIITFKELDKDALNQILDLEIDRVWQRATGTILKASENTPIKNVFTYSLTTAARNFLLAVDNENKYGARPIRRAVEKYVSQATCTFLATKQIRYPGTILIDKEKNKEQLTFALKMFDPTDIVVVPGLLDEIINKEK